MTAISPTSASLIGTTKTEAREATMAATTTMADIINGLIFQGLGRTQLKMNSKPSCIR